MIKNSHQRVPNLHHVYLLIELIRGVCYIKSDMVKEKSLKYQLYEISPTLKENI